MRCLVIAALLVSTSALARESAPLKPGTGQDTVVASCGICHTLNYIRMNSPFLSTDAWKAEVVKMRDAYGAPIDEDTVTVIVQYLSTNYAAPPKS